MKAPFVLVTVLVSGRVLKVCAGDGRIIRATVPPFLLVLSACFLTAPTCACYGTVVKAKGAGATFIFRVVAVAICLKCLCKLASYRLPLIVC